MCLNGHTCITVGGNELGIIYFLQELHRQLQTVMPVNIYSNLIIVSVIYVVQELKCLIKLV